MTNFILTLLASLIIMSQSVWAMSDDFQIANGTYKIQGKKTALKIKGKTLIFKNQEFDIHPVGNSAAYIELEDDNSLYLIKTYNGHVKIIEGTYKMEGNFRLGMNKYFQIRPADYHDNIFDTLWIGANKFETHWIGEKAFWINYNDEVHYYITPRIGSFYAFRDAKSDVNFTALLLPDVMAVEPDNEDLKYATKIAEAVNKIIRVGLDSGSIIKVPKNLRIHDRGFVAFTFKVPNFFNKNPRGYEMLIKHLRKRIEEDRLAAPGRKPLAVSGEISH
jgi:hypothetical protein